MRVGFLLPSGEDRASDVPQRYREIRAMALGAEEAGLDAVWVPDHLLPQPLTTAALDTAVPQWECWTLLTALAEATSTIRIGPMVACTAFGPLPCSPR